MLQNVGHNIDISLKIGMVYRYFKGFTYITPYILGNIFKMTRD